MGEVNVARGAALVALSVAGFSLSGAFVRHVPGLSGWQINCWRGLAMAATLGLYLILAYGLNGAWQRLRAVPPAAMLACAGFFAVGSTLYVTALTLTSTANVSAIGATSPLFTALLSPYVTGEKPSLLTWAAAIAALFGVGVIVHGALVGGHVTGNLVSLLVALSFAGQTLSLRRFRNVELMPAMAVGGITVFLLAAAIGDGLAVPSASRAILALGSGPLQLGIPILAAGARRPLGPGRDGLGHRHARYRAEPLLGLPAGRRSAGWQRHGRRPHHPRRGVAQHPRRKCPPLSLTAWPRGAAPTGPCRPIWRRPVAFSGRSA